MKYRVVFMERTNAAGENTENPPEFVDPQLMDGVVLDAQFVERTPPDALHGQEMMEEDDNFLSIGTEVWEYDIADGRERDFTEALVNSQMVIEWDASDDELVAG